LTSKTIAFNRDLAFDIEKKTSLSDIKLNGNLDAMTTELTAALGACYEVIGQ
jgi:hypothetical protein